ncbi:5'/3'-nucleotidase SurE [Crenobacter cavernae]|uniref:5'-nucleotidase n=1 Tax=Crenobacter cavernae TaxID=2290923 RepID=A0ABY0FBJ9_9NEIS|nr:5'/3'-nucleotidase SurE [Crenobacter cavernae]RXZ43426.1 acid phosphatase [Crenobacter cavernae]
MNARHALLCLPLLAALGQPAHALNILLCNDDGFTAANLRALQSKLKTAGHNVIASSPVDNQSGKGGSMDFLKPVPAVNSAERAVAKGTLTDGATGVGTDPSDSSINYVNGTPTMACLYGLDVAAPKAFGKLPDLVISGPNEGNNLGHINMSSGTVNNAFYAINRGLPAIAVSDNATSQTEWSAVSGNPAHRAFEVADIVVKLVSTLEVNKAKAGGKLLPDNTGLNVNVPSFAAGAGKNLPFVLTRMGTATDYSSAFYEDLSKNPIAQYSYGAGIGAITGKPGIGLAAGGLLRQ